ncbi:probable membrane-associated kinase regulator 2 [Sesamum indicum]|uniref:Probable membrane-associated kinase regulator 2 n=1 Tax=Sesamum indicum TaxID=4182 RepID=A0A6I9SZU9_SESIN|nr:probable membrane-associated kinase regulator 2 [Sesamum indicum]
MEAFTLLKYWRTTGGTGGGTTALFTGDSTFTTRTTTNTIVAPIANNSPYSDDGEDGPYFDLEFSLADDTQEPAGEAVENEDQTSENAEAESVSGAEELLSENENDEEEEEAELKFALTSDERADQVATLSPSDGLFHLVPIRPSSVNLSGLDESCKFPVSLLKSATKIRVLLLKLKKSKSGNGFLEKAEKSKKREVNGQVSALDERENQGKDSDDKMLTVKFKVDEFKGPLVSLFARDNSSRAASDERNLTKEVAKYLKVLKPLYSIRVSNLYFEKMKFSGQVSFRGGGPAAEKGCHQMPEAATLSNVKTHQKQGSNNLQTGLKVVRKHLGKSRSTSAAVAVSPSGRMSSNRHDAEDGIQGAILHCKRSFNASRDGESAMLCRSASDPSYDKSVVISAAEVEGTKV